MVVPTKTRDGFGKGWKDIDIVRCHEEEGGLKLVCSLENYPSMSGEKNQVVVPGVEAIFDNIKSVIAKPHLLNLSPHPQSFVIAYDGDTYGDRQGNITCEHSVGTLTCFKSPEEEK